MTVATLRRAMALMASAALVAALTVTAAAPVAAATEKAAKAEAKAEQRQARAEAKATRKQARAEAKAARKAARKQAKVVVCHKPGTPAEKTLKVPTSALKAHLRHGHEGECGASDVVPDAAPACTFDFATDIADYGADPGAWYSLPWGFGPVTSGQTVCGGAYQDYVGTVDGGTFIGGGGADIVDVLLQGTFDGGAGEDVVFSYGGGTCVSVETGCTTP